MPAARYWRITCVETRDGGDLELSELALFNGATRVDAAATLTSTAAPFGGALADLQDGSFATSALWPGAVASRPGFALVFDFGSGVTVDANGVGIAGPTMGHFAVVAALDYSPDGAQWERLGNARFEYISGESLSVFDNFDPYAANVVLLLHFDADTSVYDTSNLLRPVNVSGVNQGVTSPGFFGARCWRFQGGNSHLQIDYDDTLNFRNSDFCLEGFTLIETGGSDSTILDFRNATFNSSWVFFINHASRRLRIYDGPAGTFPLDTPVNSLPAPGAWFHWRVSRFSGVTRVFVNGSLAASATWNPPATSTFGLRIGRSADSEGYLYGLVDEICLTKGASRGVSNFTPPSRAYPDAYPRGVIPLRTPPVRPALIGEDVIGFTQAVTSTPHSPSDIYDAGRGRITGTVKEKNTPANTPLKRRVVLLSMPGSRAIRETWSDPTTGAYEFTEVAMDRVYTVVSYDHTGIYRGVVADNLIPEMM